MDVGPDNHADLHLKCKIAYIMKAGVAREQPRVSRSGKLGAYRDRRVEAFARTSAVVASGKWQMGSACRARQSRLLTWSERIAPWTGRLSGTSTSKG